MLGVIDVGGGMRCIYSGGVYDCFLDKKVKIDYCIGVSAGSGNLTSFVAGQRGRNLDFYYEYAQRKEYMSVNNFLKTGSYIGLDYIFSTICNDDGENPIDYDTFSKAETQYHVLATRAQDGKPHYFSNADLKRNCYDILKASCCLPIVCKPRNVDGVEYFDGGISEPMPFKKAFDDGCDKVIVILSKPRQEYLNPMGKMSVISRVLKDYPSMIELMATLHKRCRDSLDEIADLERQGKIIVLEPQNSFGMKTLTRDRELIMRMYTEGYDDASEISKKLL